MASDFLEYGNKAKELLRENAEELKYLAHGFRITGNARMVDELTFIAADLEEAINLVDDCMRDSLDDLVKQSEQGMANILAATLAGIEVAQEMDGLRQKVEENSDESTE